MDREKLTGLILQDCALRREPGDFSFYADGETFLSHYQPKSCDGLFLDILLGGLSGIEIARRVREQEPRLPVIFTTTEPDFALDGFSVHAMDYLVKPLSLEKVSWCMEQLREYLAVPSSIPLLEISAWGHAAPVEVPMDEILYAQYGNHIMDVHTTLGVFCTRLSFQDFTAQLPHIGRFSVCGRGLVVNLSQVERVDSDCLLLKNGEKLPFSRSRRQELQRAYTEWAFVRSRKGGWI